ncbi:MAG: hypothetical protein J6C59_10405 [Muribaculaceae bacterium]|nr:hypothetical protein [Muribaculaceae bacterium]
MAQINLPQQKSGEQTLPVLNETMPLLPSSQASSSEASSSEAPARSARQSGVSGGDTRRREDGAAEMPVVNPDAPVTPAPAAAAMEIPQAEQPDNASDAMEIPQAEEPEPADAAEAPNRAPAAVATVTEDGVKVFRGGEAAELLRGRGRAAGHLPVATASPVDGVGMLVPPEGNGEYLTAGQVEKLLHAAYMRGRNEAVAAKIEADTSIRTLPQHGDVLFSTRPSVWGRVR